MIDQSSICLQVEHRPGLQWYPLSFSWLPTPQPRGEEWPWGVSLLPLESALCSLWSFGVCFTGTPTLHVLKWFLQRLTWMMETQPGEVQWRAQLMAAWTRISSLWSWTKPCAWMEECTHVKRHTSKSPAEMPFTTLKPQGILLWQVLALTTVQATVRTYLPSSSFP